VPHDQSIRTETLTIATSLFTLYTGYLRQDLMKQAKEFAYQGKTYGELLESKNKNLSLK
jgi:hypothetical protein